MKRSTKIGCGIIALAFAGLALAISLEAYYILSSKRGLRLEDEGLVALGHQDNDTAILRFTAALQTKLSAERLAYIYDNRGFAYSRKDRHGEALRDYSEAIRLNPKLVSAYLSRGAEYDRKGEVDKAISDYTESIRLDPNSRNAYYRRGLIFVKRRELDKAIADFSEAIRCRPNDVNAYIDRGYAYVLKKDLEGALASFESAISIRPENARAHRLRADVYRQRGEWGKAIAEYQEAIRFNPQGSLAYSGRARTFEEKGDFKNALSAFREAVELCPANTSVLNDLAWFLATCPDAAFRDGKEAIVAASHACEQSHWKNSSYVDTLAAAYAEMADFDQAVKFETQALKMKDFPLPDRELAERRLVLFQQRKAYRQEPTR